MKPTLLVLALLAFCACSQPNDRDVRAAGPATPAPANTSNSTSTSTSGTVHPNSGAATLDPGTLPEPSTPMPPATAQDSFKTAPDGTTARDSTTSSPLDPAPVTVPSEPSGITDDQLAQTVRTALSNDAALASEAKSASVSVSMGVVTLRGTVRADADKSRAETIAHGVAGVERVDNQLEVVPE